MWIASSWGWYSIVRKGGNGQEWQIRARVRNDLLSLIAAAKLDAKVIETLDSDYRYRIVIGKRELHKVFETLEGSIDYPNFKNSIAKIPAQQKHLSAYHRIWGIMRGLQPVVDYSDPASQSNLWDRAEHGWENRILRHKRGGGNGTKIQPD